MSSEHGKPRDLIQMPPEKLGLKVVGDHVETTKYDDILESAQADWASNPERWREIVAAAISGENGFEDRAERAEWRRIRTLVDQLPNTPYSRDPAYVTAFIQRQAGFTRPDVAAQRNLDRQEQQRADFGLGSGQRAISSGQQRRLGMGFAPTVASVVGPDGLRHAATDGVSGDTDIVDPGENNRALSPESFGGRAKPNYFEGSELTETHTSRRLTHETYESEEYRFHVTKPSPEVLRKAAPKGEKHLDEYGVKSDPETGRSFLSGEDSVRLLGKKDPRLIGPGE